MKKYIISGENRFVVEITDSSRWQMGSRRNARIFTQAEVDALESWVKERRYEVVEIGEDEWMIRQGEEVAPSFPGF